MKATTPYRKLQEEHLAQSKRLKELEDISKAHQKQNGNLHSKIADLETTILLRMSIHQDEVYKLKSVVADYEEELKDFRVLCHLIKVSNYFENIRATQMKQARDIVDINYVP